LRNHWPPLQGGGGLPRGCWGLPAHFAGGQLIRCVEPVVVHIGDVPIHQGRYQGSADIRATPELLPGNHDVIRPRASVLGSAFCSVSRSPSVRRHRKSFGVATRRRYLGLLGIPRAFAGCVSYHGQRGSALQPPTNYGKGAARETAQREHYLPNNMPCARHFHNISVHSATRSWDGAGSLPHG